MINERYVSEKVVVAIFHASIFMIFVVFYTLNGFFQISILIFSQNTTNICHVDKKYGLVKNDLDEYEKICEKKCGKIIFLSIFIIF
jgi:hypothetical protein